MAIHNTPLDTTYTIIANGTGTLGTATSTIYFCNRSGTATTFDMHVVPTGFSANANNKVYSAKLIASNDTYIADLEKLFLAPGDSIQAFANTANAIVATVSSIGL